MRKSILRASAGMQAVALLGAGAAASFIVAAPAAAQDYTSGAIITRVTNSSGAPVAGAAVTLRSLDQGQVRTFTTDSNGNFTASGLAPGEYAINVVASGYHTYDDTLTVTAAQQSQVTVGLVSVTQSSSIVVTGRRLRQTSTGGTTGLNVDVSAVNANAPLAHDITAITLLAPTVQRGVRGFAQANGEDVPSVGGSSVAENAYYINGLNITNPDTYVGSARVPFYFYKNVDVQTGGYAAEFGRATGGVINATTKSGTNVPFLAMHIDWEPKSLVGHHPNIGTDVAPTEIGRTVKHDYKQLTLEGGGAIIPDHLFVYGLVQPQRNTQWYADGAGGAGSDNSVYTKRTFNDAFWGGKVDAYINPTQHAEFTIFDTRSKTIETNYKFTPNDALTGGTVGQKLGYQTIKTGGLNWVARYTGDLTDWITLSGAYGVSKDAGDFVPQDPSAYNVLDNRVGALTNISTQTFTQTNYADTRRRFYRGDADVRVSFAGNHHFRFGFDNEDLSMNKTTDCNGVLPICYRYYPSYVRLTYEHLGGHVTANDTAFYLEDSWQTPITGLTLNLGIRDDEFRQNNLVGDQTINFKGNWGPRAAFSYSPPSMDKWKFFGSYGRYFIPPAMNLSFRGKDLYFREAFAYPINPVTGVAYTADEFFGAGLVDPDTGLPLVNLGPAKNSVGSAPCPATPVDISNAPGAPVSGGNHCALFGAGVQNPALAKVVPGTKATYEDEFILGARYQANSLLSFGIQATYRKLGRVSEDTDFHPQLAAHYCPTATYDPVTGAPTNSDATHCDFYNSNSTYMIWNVSNTKSLVVNDWLDALSGKVTPVTLTTGMHFPTPKRSYKAVVLDFNRADDGRWMASGSVTWSKLKGSTEGTVKSDAGNGAQEDAGSTQDFDYLGLGDYGYGLLPNDHRWQFKLFGAYHFGKLLTLGANIFVQSPMHGSCLGYHPYYPQPDVYDPSTFYGAGSHFCSTGPVNANGYQDSTAPSPRGTGWKSQWLKQIDLSARVNIPFGGSDTRKLVLRADVFNVLNSHAITQRYAQHENSWDYGLQTDPNSPCSPGALECFAPDPQYLTPLYYQTPRYVRLGLDLLWGGSAPAPAPVPVIAPPPPPPAAPATQTCPDGTVILATDACPVPPPPPPPPPPPATSGERGQ